MSIPRIIHPMLVRDNPYTDPFRQPKFILQEKFDGTRVLAIKRDSRWYMMTRAWKTDVAGRFPEIVRELKKIPSNDVVLDGELTFFKRGKSEFLTVLAKPETKEGFVAKYMVFDVIRYNQDVRKYPLTERIALLHRIIPRNSPHIELVKTTRSPSEFRQTYNRIVKHQGEGVVMKKADSPYVYDSPKYWIKVKKTYSEDCVVVGITHGLGKRHATFGALILAQYDRNGHLKIVGKTSGFDDQTLLQLYNMIMRMPNYKYHELRMGDVKKWIPPKLVVEVRYNERTPYGILRHPVFIRMRTDKSAQQCRIR